MTLLAVAIFASPAALIDDKITTRRAWLASAMAVVALAIMAVYGTVRLARAPTRLVEQVKLRIMQPNLPQDAKFNYSARRDVMARYLALSDRSAGPGATGVRDATHLIWPESAFPFFLQREPEAFLQGGPAVEGEWTPERIESEIAARVEAKKAKNFAEADRIRKVLLDAGIVLEDSAKGTTWRRS